MKVKIDTYEVEIKAKDAILGHERMNKRDTMEFLNMLCCWMIDLEESYRKRGYDVLADACYSDREGIFQMLKENGLYKDILTD